MEYLKRKKSTRRSFGFWASAVLSLSSLAFATAQPLVIDTAKSVVTVHVYRSGIFSAFGHDHEISAPIARGTVDIEKRMVEL
jgi:hypothetical protein